MVPLCSKHADMVMAPIVLGFPKNCCGGICIDLDYLYYLFVLR